MNYRILWFAGELAKLALIVGIVTLLAAVLGFSR